MSLTGETRLAEPQEDRPVFMGLEPHPESPITEESFYHLDHVIGAANSMVGISAEETHAYAYSPPQEEGGPDMSVTRYEGPNGLRVLSVISSMGDAKINVLARNDAGTVSNPRQPAASLMIVGRNGLMLGEDKALQELDITSLTEDLGKRLRNQTLGQKFVKKQSIVRI
ncbi:hypothetical protein A3B63_03155 [Candidatus Saccharibacteria bacterium RIFCSPLOWO2_01_FULL_49_22]|nr:MAG: hypothetical protein A3B63_03155 [Candidatus Saccharibacteria bacterium RIFCSPLOWO2_01_FULL_49_22]